MLHLSRLAGQSIQIGPDITLHINDIRGSKVRLGIEAPRSLEIHRTELLGVGPPTAVKLKHDLACGRAGQIVPCRINADGKTVVDMPGRAPFVLSGGDYYVKERGGAPC